jgi:hypothetical protein
MIAPIRPPIKPTRSPVVERARSLLTTTLLPPDAKPGGKAQRAVAWKAWLLGGILLAVALWLGYLAIAARL